MSSVTTFECQCFQCFMNDLRLEARVGIEPTHKGLADLSLTTWVPRPEIKVSPESGIVYRTSGDSLPQQNALQRRAPKQCLERETGFEPATSTLARSHSTAELLPLSAIDYKRPILQGQTAQGNIARRFYPVL